MSRNISLLSGKKDDKNSLFGKISVSPNETTDAQLAGEYNLGVSTIHSTKSSLILVIKVNAIASLPISS